MTLNELSQLYWLTREIEADRRRLQELEQKASAPSSVNLSGAPRINREVSSVELMAERIVELKNAIQKKQEKNIAERIRLERYISEIPDSYLRQTFYYRFVLGLSWRQVAFRLGGGNTADGVRKACRRYLDKR